MCGRWSGTQRCGSLGGSRIHEDSIVFGTSTGRSGPTTSRTTGPLPAEDAAEAVAVSLASLLVSSVGIDLGHHQALAARATSGVLDGGFDSGHELIGLGATTNGLVVRWCEDGTPTERLHDRLARLVAAGDLRSAASTASAIAECLADLVPVDGDELRIAVPVGISLGHRAHLRAAFTHAGFSIAEHHLVPRPYAVLAHWLSIGGHRRLEHARGKTLVIDNDGGRSSALVADIGARQILAEREITTDHTAGPDTASAALRALLEAAYGSSESSAP